MRNKYFFNKYIFIIIISGILSTAGWFYFGNPSDTISGDAGYYWNAINIINDNISNILFSRNIGNAESFNVIVLGILSHLPVNLFVLIYIFQILLYSLTAVIIYKFSLDFIGKKGAIFVLIFYFINYRHLQYIYILKPGVWVNFLLSLSFFLAYYIYKHPQKTKYWILFGISAGFLFLQDMRYIPHIGILVLALSVQLKPFKENYTKIPVFIITLIIIVSPWIIRQSLVYNRFIFISDMGTISIHKAFKTDYYNRLGENYKYFENLTPEEFRNQFYKLCDSLKLSPAELIYSGEKGNYEKFRSQKVNKLHEKLIADGKLTRAEVEKLVQTGENKSKFRQYFEYGLSMWIPLNWDYRYEPMSVRKYIFEPISKPNLLIIIITSSILIPFLFFAAYYNLKTKNVFGITLLILFAIHTVIHVLTYAQSRYMLPLLPFISAVAYQGIIQFNKIFIKIKKISNSV